MYIHILQSTIDPIQILVVMCFLFILYSVRIQRPNDANYYDQAAYNQENDYNQENEEDYEDNYIHENNEENEDYYQE